MNSLIHSNPPCTVKLGDNLKEIISAGNAMNKVNNEGSKGNDSYSQKLKSVADPVIKKTEDWSRVSFRKKGVPRAPYKVRNFSNKNVQKRNNMLLLIQV